MTHFIDRLMSFAATFWLGFKILVKLDIFSTYFVNGIFIKVKRIDDSLRIDKTSCCKHQVLIEIIFVVKVQFLDNFIIEEIFGKLWNLERVKLVFYQFVSEVKLTIIFIFKLFQLIDVKISDIAHEILVDILVGETTCTVLWISATKLDTSLKFGCYCNQALLIDLSLTIPC